MVIGNIKNVNFSCGDEKSRSLDGMVISEVIK